MNCLTRREFVGRTMLAAGALLAKQLSAATDRHQVFGIMLGVQSYMVDDELQRDFTGTLKQLTQMGYHELELASFYERSAKQLHDELHTAGMQCVAAHFPPRPFLASQRSLTTHLDELIADSRALGLKYMVCPFPLIPDALQPSAAEWAEPAAAMQRVFARMSLGDWQAHAEFLNRTAMKVRAAGMRLAYHNHNVEFRSYDGVIAYDELLRRTDPALVSMEMDCGWVLAAGFDPITYLARYPKRFTLLHLKDLVPAAPQTKSIEMNSVELGKGSVDWNRLLQAARVAGVERAYVEQEPPFTRSRFESARISLEYLNSLNDASSNGAHS